MLRFLTDCPRVTARVLGGSLPWIALGRTGSAGGADMLRGIGGCGAGLYTVDGSKVRGCTSTSFLVGDILLGDEWVEGCEGGVWAKVEGIGGTGTSLYPS
jgi:hypothetical protein